MMNPIKHTREDAELIVSVSLPSDGASSMSSVLDIGQLGGIDDANLCLRHGDAPALVAAKKLTLTIEGSSDCVTGWAEVSGVTTVTTGGASNGASASKQYFRIPMDAPRYLRLKASVEASGGDNKAVVATLALTI